MVEMKVNPEARTADLGFAGACPLCEGQLEVRTSPGGTWSYCPRCRWLSRTWLGMTPRGMHLAHQAATA